MTIEQRAYVMPMRRTTVALLLCGCLLFGGCGSFQIYAQGIPLNDEAEKSFGRKVWDATGVVIETAAWTYIFVVVAVIAVAA